MAPPHIDSQPPVKLSVNVSADLGSRLRRLAFDERVSESSIVEIALAHLFDLLPEGMPGAFLRERGAVLRRGGRNSKLP